MEHDDYYRQIVRSLTDGIITLALDGTVRYANSSAEVLLGATGLGGRQIHDFLDADGKQHADGHLARAAAGNFLDTEVDTMLVRADGSPLWVRLRQTRLVEHDKITGVILRLTDNHETKKLLDELSESRERLVRAERVARSGSWTWDARTGETTSSAGMERLYGDHLVDILGPDRDRVISATHPEDHDRMEQALDQLRDGPDPYIDVELRQRGRHGWMWVRLRALGTYSDDGALVEATGTYQDITRARDTEDHLQDLVTQNSLMQTVASAANEATTLDEVLVQARSLVVLHDDWDRARAFLPSPDGSGLVPHLFDDGAADMPTAAIELAVAEECYRLRRSVWDPERRLTIAFPVLLDEDVIAVLTITSLPPLYRHEMIQQMAEQTAVQLTRVAERERAARELADARDRAMTASQHKSDFLATMSHEIRTPLNGVIGLNELLGATSLSDRQQHLVSGIAVSSHSLLDLINDVLDFSKIEAGRLEVEQVDVEVREVLAEVGNMLAESARSRDIELRVSCSPDVPDVLSGDPVRLKQVLLNLGSNAVKFTTAGSVGIRATAEPLTAEPLTDHSTDHSTGGTLLRVEVRDTGMGITPDQQRQIFAPFTQADSTTTRRFGGTGLGLAICAEIVAAFRGEIGVESEPGAGSTFWFTVPLGPATGNSQDVTLARARSTLGDARILVVDDNPQNRMILCEQLGWWHAASTPADGPVQALAALAAATAEGRPYDALLLDLAMPDHDGLTLAAAVRAGGYPRELPLILLTSSHTPTDDVLREAGITTCLSKPVPSSTLRDVLLATFATDAPESGVRTTISSPHARPDRGRVLVVEDNTINQVVARGFLESQGWAVETADDGEMALRRVAENDYDAVLMDVQMPVLDGYAATRELRGRDARAADGGRLPVIAMTATAVSGEREKCLAAGMDDFLTKPISLTSLSTVLGRWTTVAVETPTSTMSQATTGQPTSDQLDLERLGMLLDLLPGDTTYLDRAIGNFLGRRLEVLGRLHDAVDTEDVEALTAHAHALRGSASNLGLPVVAQIASDLEEIGRAGTTDAADQLTGALEEALNESAEAILAYRDWYQSLSEAAGGS